MIFNLIPPSDYRLYDKLSTDKNIKVSFVYRRHAIKGYFRDYDIYSIEIDTLDNLLYLINTLKPQFGLVIRKAEHSTLDDYYDKTDEPYEFTLEIYDSWRE